MNQQKKDRLSGVAVKFYHDEESRIGAIRMPDSISNEKGEYEIFFWGSPKLPKSVFVEFLKEGYQTRQVYFTRKVTDPTVDIKSCTKEEKFECWIVNVMMVPVAEP